MTGFEPRLGTLLGTLQPMQCDADEKPLVESVERGEWKSAAGDKRERARFSRYAKARFRKDRRVNIRLSSKDLEAIQKRAYICRSEAFAGRCSRIH